jgi:hypothetical protein
MIPYVLRLSIGMGQTRYVRRILEAYGAWLSPKGRMLAWAIAIVPEPVMVLASRAYRRCVAPLRLVLRGGARDTPLR